MKRCEDEVRSFARLSLLIVVPAALSSLVGCALETGPEVPAPLRWEGGLRGPGLIRLRVFELPDEIAKARDVRWSSDSELLFGRGGHRMVGGAGVYAWRIGEPTAELVAILSDHDVRRLFAESRFVRLQRLRAYADYSLVGGAVSDGIAFAGGAHGVFLQGADDEGGPELLKDVGLIHDLDRRGDLTAAVGLDRNQRPDRADGGSFWEPQIAWLFKDGDHEVRSLLPTRDQGESMSRCNSAGLSVVRFIAEDRVLVVPGAEPGLFVFDGNGTLVESLEAEALLADAGCDVEGRELLGERTYRLAWLGSRRVIDEVVADGSGNVYFFVRRLADGRLDFGDGEDSPRGRVCWDLLHARADDLRGIARTECAVESVFADARLRADLRGERAVILLEDGVAQNLGRPAEVFEARLTPPGG